MRILIDALGGRTGGATPADLADLYRAPRLPWLRVNMVGTVDGAATGESGRSGSINNAVDKVVFHALRAECDAILVGAGTARTEGYREAAVPIVVVSHSGSVPEQLVGCEPGKVLLATCAASPGLDDARGVLGAEQVIVAGESAVDLPAVKAALVERGLRDVLSEGGPSLLRDLVASGAADELTLTVVPRLIAGVHPRVLRGEPIDADLDLALLLEQDGTLLARYLLR
ncbi:dihydrofolate reductase family protein [Marmoricola sp. RAF53]|uniref:dihydrofolate reductase family protein n=1 Tax=Marmoricola sp. RAF53 TaxID=3233059 RepID=UPI003F94F222